MGFFRVRRSFKLGPIGRVYLGKKGASLSVGVRGAHVNVGNRGTRMTVGIPGSGISYTARLGSGGAPMEQQYPVPQAARSKSGIGCLKAIVILVALGFIGGIAKDSPVAAVVVMIMLIGAWIFVSRTIKKGREARRRHALEAQQAEYVVYQAEQQRQYAVYQAEQERLAVVKAREDAERARLSAEMAAEEEQRRRERWDAFVAKYGEADAQRVWAGRPWVGCTYGMLIDAMGPPVDIDEKVMKTKTKHTYKYKPTGVNRYALRVYLDDGVVTGWDDKSD
jgi:hypothetical protein